MTLLGGVTGNATQSWNLKLSKIQGTYRIVQTAVMKNGKRWGGPRRQEPIPEQRHLGPISYTCRPFRSLQLE